MKQITYFLSIAALFTIQSCGPKADNSLAGKKAELATLKAQNKELVQKMATLETDILKLDPASKAAEKIKAVVTTPLVARTFNSYIEVQGTVEATNIVMVTPRSAGAYTAIYIKEGDAVAKGQTVARLDDAIMRESIEEIKNQLSLATLLYDKQKALWDQKIGTELQYLQAKNGKESLEKRLATTNTQLGMSAVKAPMSGVVDQMMAKIGDMGMPGVPLARVINLGTLKATANVGDTYLKNVRVGDAVLVKLPDLEKQMNARVNFVSKIVNPSSRTFKIEAAIPSSADIKPNMVSMLRITDKSTPNAIAINQNYIQNTEDGEIVYVAVEEGGKKIARARKIKTGAAYAGEIEITDGLKAGDILITEGYQELVDGQIITF